MILLFFAVNKYKNVPIPQAWRLTHKNPQLRGKKKKEVDNFFHKCLFYQKSTLCDIEDFSLVHFKEPSLNMPLKECACAYYVHVQFFYFIEKYDTAKIKTCSISAVSTCLCTCVRNTALSLTEFYATLLEDHWIRKCCYSDNNISNFKLLPI